MWNVAKSLYGWMIRRPGYILLTGSDQRVHDQVPTRFAWAWGEVMAFSLVWGIVSVGIWSAAWSIFQDYGTIIVPAVATLSFLVLLPLRRSLISVAELLGGEDSTARAVVGSLVVTGLAFCLIRMKSGIVYFESPLAPVISWIRPDHELYRALVLMPLWGGWSTLILGRFCKPDEQTEPAVAAFSRGCGPLVGAICMGVVLVWSIMYFRYLPWTQLSISGAAIFAAVVGGTGLCKVCGGLKRKVLLGTNLLTQIVFLLAYLANSR